MGVEGVAFCASLRCMNESRISLISGAAKALSMSPLPVWSFSFLLIMMTFFTKSTIIISSSYTSRSAIGPMIITISPYQPSQWPYGAWNSMKNPFSITRDVAKMYSA